jgi:hypothetical protein
MSLGPEEQAVVQEALEEIQETPPPPDRGPLGCVVALPGFVLLLLYPPAARFLDLPGWAGIAALSAGIPLVSFGLILWFTAGRLGRRHAMAASEAALLALESWTDEEAEREEALRAATLLLMSSFAQSGPTFVATFDASEARKRIGPRMPLVEAVERYLLEQEAVHPLFTREEEPPEGR